MLIISTFARRSLDIASAVWTKQGSDWLVVFRICTTSIATTLYIYVNLTAYHFIPLQCLVGTKQKRFHKCQMRRMYGISILPWNLLFLRSQLLQPSSSFDTLHLNVFGTPVSLNELIFTFMFFSIHERPRLHCTPVFVFLYFRSHSNIWLFISHFLVRLVTQNTSLFNGVYRLLKNKTTHVLFIFSLRISVPSLKTSHT